MLFWWRRSGTQLFEIRARYHDDGSFPTSWVRNIDNVDLQWAGGRPIIHPLPAVIEYSVDKNLVLDDFVLTAGGPILISPDLWSLLREASSCARSYPSVVLFGDHVVSDRYVTVNFERAFPCLDLARSRFSEGPYSPEKYNGMLEKIVISARRLPETEKVFRLGESPTHLLSTLDFKHEVEKRAITGIEFTQLRVSE
ncbi:MAG: hypothetical protein AB2L07_19145 [Thermoanaerobaculaceae bacterium]